MANRSGSSQSTPQGGWEGQGMSQQPPGQLEPGQVWPAPRQGPPDAYNMIFLFLSLPRSQEALCQ